MRRNTSGSITPWLLALFLIGTFIAITVVPEWIRRGRTENERLGPAGLKALTTAEADYWANDRDRNGVQDFWTADVAGLYRYGLLPREIAEADAAPLVPLVPEPIPYKGHFFRALTVDESETPPVPYREDTDGKSGKVHHPIRFGFVAYPAGGITAPKYMWIINQNNSPFRSVVTSPPPANWPSDTMLKYSWSKVD